MDFESGNSLLGENLYLCKQDQQKKANLFQVQICTFYKCSIHAVVRSWKMFTFHYENT